MAKKSRPKTTKQTIVKHHSDWMRLVERSGPFLSIPVLLDVLPQGLSKDDSVRRGDLRQLYESWQADRDDIAVHRGWIKSVLTECLEIPDDYFYDAGRIPTTLQHRVPEHHEKLTSDMAVIETSDDGSDKPRLLVMIVPPNQALDKAIPGKQWKATPQTRMSDLVRGCSATGVSLGLVTNGEQWTLVSSKPGETASFTTWYAGIWFDEPVTLRAFCELLSAQRFFGDPDLTLEKLLERSAQHQHQVTDQLGLQVRDALETLVEAIDQIDRDQKRKLLKGFSETQLYEACVTVMMRLVFLFFAEEQRLLPVKEAFYEQNYSLLNLLEQLQEKSHAGEELLEWGGAAWSRLLAMFRAIHSGVRHDDMQLHAYGSSLFDPDRFPFLEGRARGTSWKEVEASPLPINDRTILHILEALKLLEVPGISTGERITRRMSFRELDVEDIGHIYENLLDHTTKRASGHVLGLTGTKGKEPEIELVALEQKASEGREKLVEYLNEQTGKSASAINKALDKKSDLSDSVLLTACSNDTKLFERVKPYANLLRQNRSQQPTVVSDGGVYVTEGTDRRSSGTHYTPRSLTEPIVRHTLEPLVYEGPAEGRPEEKWKLKSPAELLDLKICDMACGSGAFLVQACRYMGERLVDSWAAIEEASDGSPRITPSGEPSKGEPNEQLIPVDSEERRIYAQRLIADRCLYGVDKNPLAVEMGKLSLWLLTLAKDKPFTFLDHAIRCGDSLVGISSIDQLLNFSMSDDVKVRPVLEQQRKQIENKVNAVALLRNQIERLPSNTPQQIEQKTAMLEKAEEQTARLRYAADMLLANYWEPMTVANREVALNSTLADVEYKFKDLPTQTLNTETLEQFAELGIDGRFHWSLEFPEVFAKGGFDAFLGNPPFLGGRRISLRISPEYFAFLKSEIGEAVATTDLCVYFLRRAFLLLKERRMLGLLLSDVVSQGDSRETGLNWIVQHGGQIYNGIASRHWPGTAGVKVAHVHIVKGEWGGAFRLDNCGVSSVSSYLKEDGAIVGDPKVLRSSTGICYTGHYLMGQGFVVSKEVADQLVRDQEASSEVLFPYIRGEDINNEPSQQSANVAINFGTLQLDIIEHRFSKCLEIIRRDVKPERDGVKDKSSRENWWRYARPRPELTRAISGLSEVVVQPFTAKYLNFSYVSAESVFAHPLVVITDPSPGRFAVLVSSLHEVWVRQYCSTSLDLMRYTASSVFDTFPFPCLKSLLAIGVMAREYRDEMREVAKLSLNELYNQIHDVSNHQARTIRGRNLHVQIDDAVAEAYGWDDLSLGHDFHETKQGIRFTICETARLEILQRLLKLNHECHANEIAQGLQGKKASRESTLKKKDAKQPELFAR